MAWYEVPVWIWVEADDASAAMDAVIDSMPDGRIIGTGEVRELNPDEMESLLGLRNTFDTKSAL